MEENSKIKIILVTGFLGSGKTTFLNRIIDFYSSKKIALVINDFGKIAVDGILLRDRINEKSSSRIYEIANGSIFCSCLSAELVKSLKYFLDKKPEILIVETSGLSDPSTFEQILNDNNLDRYYKIDNSICILDSTNVLKLYNRILAIQRQIVSSNILLINKSDLIKDTEYIQIEEQIKFINRKSLIFRTEYSKFDFSLLENTQQTKSLSNVVNCNTVENKPGSILLSSKELTQRELNNFYSGISKNVLRIKGFLKIGGTSYYISDNIGKLQFVQFNENSISHYGLSVLLNKENVTLLQKAWNLL